MVLVDEYTGREGGRVVRPGKRRRKRGVGDETGPLSQG